MCIVYDKLLKPRQSFRITLYSAKAVVKPKIRGTYLYNFAVIFPCQCSTTIGTIIHVPVNANSLH